MNLFGIIIFFVLLQPESVITFVKACEKAVAVKNNFVQNR